jgi:hypothetical protein
MPAPVIPSDFELLDTLSEVKGSPARLWMKRQGSSRVLIQELVFTDPTNGSLSLLPLVLEEAWLQDDHFEPIMTYDLTAVVVFSQPFVSAPGPCVLVGFLAVPVFTVFIPCTTA